MIPKTIHYCWFGRGELPKLANKCIESWKKYCPDYEIVEWNEDNFDINCCVYVKEAYENKKYAFVSDYVRLHAMYNYGGVYMDTDVELVKPIESFLENCAFSGFESDTQIPTGIMASEKGFELFGKLLEYYEDRHFVGENGILDTTTNVVIITSLLSRKGFSANGELQTVEGFTLYPKDYFCPLNSVTGKLNKTRNTVAIHWFNQSWVEPKDRIIGKITRIFHRFLGVNCFVPLKKIMIKLGIR